MFSLFPEKGSPEHYRIRPLFEPSPFSPDAYTSLWQEISTGTGDFSGKKVDKGNQVAIQRTALDAGQSIATLHNQKIKKVFAVGCYYKVSTAENRDIEQDCEQFFQGVEFVDR